MAAAAPLILLTGATGFVGRQVLRELAKRNCRVRARRQGWQAKQIAQSRRDRNGRRDAGLVVRKRRMVGRCLPRRRYRDPRRLVCRAGRSIFNRRRISIAWRGRCGLRKGRAQAKVRRFVGIGTCFEYDLSVGPFEHRKRRCGRRRLMPRQKPPPSRRCRSRFRNRGSSLPGAGCFISTGRARMNGGWCPICAPSSGPGSLPN